MRKVLSITPLLFALASSVSAASVSDITAPLTKIYSAVQGIVSVLGVLAITVAGALYMFSGNNIMARENAKSMVSYTVVGLVLVWVAPIIVNYLTAPVPAT